MARRGRKRKPNVKRQPNGQPSRTRRVAAAREEDIKSVVLDYRRRRYGLSKEQAGDALSEWQIGRLFLNGIISDIQHEAADRYRRVAVAHRRAICNLDGPPRSPSLERLSSGEQEERLPADVIARIRKEFDMVDAALRDAGEAARMTVERTCLADQPLQDSQTALLRRGLDAVAKAYRLDARRRPHAPDRRLGERHSGRRRTP